MRTIRITPAPDDGAECKINGCSRRAIRYITFELTPSDAAGEPALVRIGLCLAHLRHLRDAVEEKVG